MNLPADKKQELSSELKKEITRQCIKASVDGILDKYEKQLKYLETEESVEQIKKQLSSAIESMPPYSVKQIGQLFIQIDEEGMNYDYNYPNQWLNKAFEESIAEMFQDWMKELNLDAEQRSRATDLLVRVFVLTMKHSLGIIYQGCIDEIALKTKQTIENTKDYFTEFETLMAIAGYYGKLKQNGFYMTLDQAFQDAVERQCTYRDRNGNTHRVTEVKKLKKAWDNIFTKNKAEDFGVERYDPDDYH